MRNLQTPQDNTCDTSVDDCTSDAGFLFALISAVTALFGGPGNPSPSKREEASLLPDPASATSQICLPV